MKISNYMNNANLIVEKNATKAKNEEGLELRRQSLQNGRMYHWILSKVLKMAEGQ